MERVFERGDIVLVDFDPSLGHEQQGRRPALILTKTEFNQLAGVAIVAPITTKGRFAKTRGFAVALPEGELKTTGIVRVDQVQTLDLLARRASVLEQAPQDVTLAVLMRLGLLLDPDI